MACNHDAQTAAGVFAAGGLFSALGGGYASEGTACGLLYALGLEVIWLVPADGQGQSPQAA